MRKGVHHRAFHLCVRACVRVCLCACFLALTVVRIEELLDPLQHLEVVLELSLDQSCNIDVLGDLLLVKDRLEDFVVRHVLIFGLGVEVDLAQGNLARIDRVQDLAVHRTSARLLDLRVTGIEEIVQPFEQNDLQGTKESTTQHRGRLSHG